MLHNEIVRLFHRILEGEFRLAFFELLGTLLSETELIADPYRY